MTGVATLSWRTLMGVRNPFLVRGLGLTPFIAAATDPVSGAVIGCAYAFVLIGVNSWLALARNFVATAEQGLHIVIAAGAIAATVDAVLGVVAFPWYAALQPYVILLAVSALVHDRAELIALRAPWRAALYDAFQHGVLAIGFGLVVGALRSWLAGGQLASIEQVAGAAGAGPALAASAAAGFIVVGLLAGVWNAGSTRIVGPASAHE